MSARDSSIIPGNAIARTPATPQELAEMSERVRQRWFPDTADQKPRDLQHSEKFTESKAQRCGCGETENLHMAADGFRCAPCEARARFLREKAGMDQ